MSGGEEERPLLPCGEGVGDEGRSDVLAPDRLHAPHPPTPSPQGRGGASITAALSAFDSWNARGGAERGRILRAMADALQDNHDPLVALTAREAGRNLQDSIDEVREAIDFCRYYAAEAERLFAAPQKLPSPAGETDHLELHGRGVFVCISPWNFPLAIFTGQLAAGVTATMRGVTKISSSLRESLISSLRNSPPSSGIECRYGTRDWRCDLSTT